MLSGVRVLDLTRLLPGPYATLLLADLGAEVIKLEPPGSGDNLRHFQPQIDDTGVFFLAVNRNKKSITLNLKEERGREIFLQLVRDVDVVFEGFRHGVMDKLGVGYAVLKKVNPGLIYCSLSGYGQTGPHRDRAGHDLNYLSVGGVLGITGTQDGEPVLPGIQVADMTGGIFAVVAILAALRQKEREGQGACIDMSMTDGLISLMSIHLLNQITTGVAAKPGRMMFTGAQACYHVYGTQDGGYVAFGALEAKFWANFCQGVGREDLLPGHTAPATADNPVYRQLQEIFAAQPLEYWREFAQRVDCCLTPVEDVEQVLHGDYARERELFIDVPLARGGSARQVRSPMLFAGQSSRPAAPPPDLGQHNEEIYATLGLDAAELARLKEAKII